MKLFDILKQKMFTQKNRAKSQTWYPASYYPNSNYSVFESDTVLQAIRCVVQEIKKLEPRHIVKSGNRYKSVYDSIQMTLDDPNELMTTADFLEKVAYSLLTTNNSFILPTWENGNLVALYPLYPEAVDFVQDNVNTLHVHLRFANGYEALLRYSDVIHVRYNFGPSEYMGGDIEGKPDVKTLQKSVNLNESLLDGVQKSIKSSYAINGVVKYNTLLDDGKTEEELKKLAEKINNNESGFMPLDLKGEFIPFNKDVKLVDEATLKFADEKLLRTYRISVPILSGDFTPEQYASFYQAAIEPIVVTLNQAFSKTLFTREGRTILGHRIEFCHDKLDTISILDKERVGTLLSNTGAIEVDELRHMLSMPPCEDETLGKTMIMSKNFGSAESVKDMVTVQAEAQVDAAKAEADAVKSKEKNTN